MICGVTTKKKKKKKITGPRFYWSLQNVVTSSRVAAYIMDMRLALDTMDTGPCFVCSLQNVVLWRPHKSWTEAGLRYYGHRSMTCVVTTECCDKSTWAHISWAGAGLTHHGYGPFSDTMERVLWFVWSLQNAVLSSTVDRYHGKRLTSGNMDTGPWFLLSLQNAAINPMVAMDTCPWFVWSIQNVLTSSMIAQYIMDVSWPQTPWTQVHDLCGH